MIFINRDGQNCRQLFEANTADVDTDDFLSLFDVDQVFYLEFVGQKWRKGSPDYAWFCSLKDTSAT